MIYKTIVLLIILFGISFFLFYIFSGYYNIKSITLIDIEIKDNKKVISYKKDCQIHLGSLFFNILFLRYINHR